MTRIGLSRRLAEVWPLALGVGVMYYLGARVGLALSFPPDYIGALWPPNAILLAALLRSRPRQWAWIMLAVVPAELAADIPSGIPGWQALSFVACDFLECGMIAALLRRWTVVDAIFDNLKQAVIYLLVAVLAVPNVVGLVWAGWSVSTGISSEFATTWGRWAHSDGLTHLVVTPFILTWVSRRRLLSFMVKGASRLLEGAAMLLVTFAVSILVFGTPFPSLLTQTGVPFLVYMPLPVLIWAALRFRSAGVSLAALIISTAAIWSASRGIGPFVENSVGENVLGLQLFLAVVAAPMIFLAALISERGVATQMVGEAAQRLSLHVRYNPLGVIELNRSFGVVEWNRAAELIFGYSRREAIGRSVWDLIVPENEREAMRTAWNQVPAPGSTGDPQLFTSRTKDGTARLCEWYSSPLINANGEIFGTAAMVQDITNRRLLEEEIRQSQKMEAVGRLAGGIAHDFNNLLTAILGHCELALLSPIENPSLKEAFVEIQRAGSRARDTVKQILGFSHRRSGDWAAIDMADLVNEVANFVRTSIPSNIQISTVITQSSCVIHGDSSEVHRVIMNLVTNAYQAMRHGEGVIEIELARVLTKTAEGRELEAAHLMVRDTGPGMSEEVRTRIFDPFFTTKKMGEGSGMGLAVVHGIVGHHGGWIQVESASGLGSTFHVYLPLYHGESEVTSEKMQLDHLPQGTERILLVDDDPVVARIERTMLSRLGYQVEMHTNAPRAWQRLEQGSSDFDLVITDQAMPDMTGLQLIEHMRDAGSDLPAIVCTGFTDALNPENEERLAIGAVLHKPVTLEILARRVYEVLRRNEQKTSQ